MYIGVDPTNRLVEITAFDGALVRTSGECHGKASDRKGPSIRGITFTQYAYRALEIEGKKPATLVSEEPTDEPLGPAESVDLRQGGRGHDARELHDLLLLPRGRLLPRGPPRRSGTAWSATPAPRAST